MYGDLMRYAQGPLPKLTSCQTVPSSLRLNLSFAAGSAQKSCVGQAACREILGMEFWRYAADFQYARFKCCLAHL